MNERIKSGRRGRKAVRKPPPRWRKHLVQAELELPSPSAGSTDAACDDPDALPDDDAAALPWWQTRLAVYGLGILCLLLAVTAGFALRRAAVEHEAALAAERAAQTLTLRAVNSERTLRLAPNPRSWSRGFDATLAWPEPPELLELYVPVRHAPGFHTFALVVDKVDHGRVMVVERLVADSNRDLRLAVNSTAFGPGEYRIRVQGYTWRGQRVDVGWIRWMVRERD